MTMLTQAEAERLVASEGRLLDICAWDDWLDLYAEDALYWVPSWRNEAEPTSSPDNEISLIYYEGRQALVDRVWRLKSGLSPASIPLRRTAHLASNVLLQQPLDDAATSVTASFAVHHFDPKRQTQHVLFGQYEYAFRLIGQAWRIARKKTLLANDLIPGVLDFYMI